jgi:hypothetical protein
MAHTAPLVVAGLVGGYATARYSKKRPLGGVVLAAAGGAAAKQWAVRLGSGRAVVLGAVYLGGFGASHPLAKKIGAWPAVGVVTAVAAGAATFAEARGARRSRAAG